MKLCCVFMLMLAGYWSNPVVASDSIDAELPRAEVVWVENDAPQHMLRYSQNINNKWRDSAVTVYRSENPLTTPTLVTRSTGEKYLFWSEQIANQAVLKMMKGQVEFTSKRKIIWQEPAIFSDLGRFSISPTSVVDWRDNIWLFWAADVANYSDIYYSTMTESGWLKPDLVHSTNNVPDNTPFVRMNENGALNLTWHTFDTEVSQYKTAVKEFLVNSPLPENELRVLLVAEKETIASIAPPEFLPKNQRLTVHFPKHRLLQSVDSRLLGTPTIYD